MAVPTADQDLRIRNVTLHSRERKEHGTLHLYRHHLQFRYDPNNGHAARGTFSTGKRPSAQDGKLSTESSGLTESSSTSASGVVGPQGASNVAGGRPSMSHEVNESTAKPREAHPKHRTKEIWLPYPMINHCTLRPSHLQSQVMKPKDDSGFVPVEDDDSNLFPPVFGTSSYERPSTDSARLAPFSSPQRPVTPLTQERESSVRFDSGRQPAIRIRRKDLQMLALHFHPSESGKSADETARKVFFVLRSRCCVERVESLHAFHFHAPEPEIKLGMRGYDARKEYARMGIGEKAADGPGTAWRISDINRDYSYSATYPSVLCVPKTVSDNLLKYGGAYRSRSRIPCLAYLHSNGGSITRSSQPLVGVQNRRNPQDERLVSAIFSSHTPPLQSPEDSPPQAPSLSSPSTTTLDSVTADSSPEERPVPSISLSRSDPALNEKLSEEQAAPLRKKIYGSTRRNLIVDARPKINALANRATGGGIEDVTNYASNGGMPVEKVFLNIANIHVMRTSLEKVIESFANSDYLNLKPDQELLRKSGWLGHIANMMDGAEMVARVVGLGGSHVLVHCSDGWDRTAQISALAQIMLDPYYRTLEGFMTLIQKDFLSFGHKFRDRNGIEGSDKWFEIENERIAPSRTRDSSADPNSLNAIGAKALSGAKNWFEKGRGSLFRQPNTSQDSLADPASSRPSSPPPNPLLHSPPPATTKEDKDHRANEKEISPIFHQFLDATYQLLHHHPTAFEFRDQLLKRLFYHTYACQYGEFLFNSEKERSQYAGKVPSVWPHLMSRRKDFINPDYAPKDDDALLFPTRRGSDKEIQVRWWHSLFLRSDEEMNVPRALAPADPPAMTANFGSSVSFDDQALDPEKSDGANSASNGSLRESKSAPNLEKVADDSTTDSFAALNIDGQADVKAAAATGQIAPRSQDADAGREDKQQQPAYIERSPVLPTIESMEYEGDPLGVSASNAQGGGSERLDFAAFARGSAFRDR
ncbi:phosphatidylinositol-3-phosphatase ymr1 [Saxophila tyrrhenica]|uniref:Phosphatidylinositol-3-phosphatase ymr1 n=1 Tax=Saxophila tyrrhenica TaxID=1690608 RepID=A0AAV9PMN6_9PEZI|nr:phosphatidylinositol-3-phosphatase ymr1 [Saxophila tyrrhenica]